MCLTIKLSYIRHFFLLEVATYLKSFDLVILISQPHNTIFKLGGGGGGVKIKKVTTMVHKGNVEKESNGEEDLTNSI